MLNKKILFWGFDDYFAELAKENHVFKDSKFVSENLKITLHDLSTLNFRADGGGSFRSELWNNEKFVDEMYAKFDRIVKRHDITLSDESRWLKFCFLLELASELLNEVDILVFGLIPHLGFDVIAYEIAKELKVRTIITNPSIFPGYSFVSDQMPFFKNNLSLYGKTSQAKEINPFSKGLILKYMEPIRVKAKTPSLRISNLWKTLKKYYRNALLTNLLVYKLLKAPKNILIRLKYKLTLNSSAVEYIPDDSLVFYFPLHMQPEMTTEILGGIWRDQILALEYCVSILTSKNIKFAILVKENPKQKFEKRSSYFYKRLKNLSNTVLVDKNIDTKDLLARSDAVITISGTAGFEALIAGKPVIYFGDTWYFDAPGAVFYKDFESYISEIVRTNENYRSTLISENKTWFDLTLKKRLIPLTLDLGYRPEDFNRVDNFEKFVSFVRAL